MTLRVKKVVHLFSPTFKGTYMSLQYKTIRRVLGTFAEITPPLLIRIMDALGAEERALTKKGAKDNRKAWTGLIQSARHARNTTNTNRPRWSPNVIPIYEEYLTLIDTMIARMEKARDTIDPDTGHLHTPETFARTRIGKEDKGACLPHRWQTWCPPQVAANIVHRMDVARQGLHGRPHALFWPASDAKAFDAQAHRHRVTIKKLRHQFASRWEGSQDDEPLAPTPQGALWLAAARMAELRLNQLTSPKANTTLGPIWTRVIPANFYALLDAPMRRRLREMARNPDSVLLDASLRQYYDQLAHVTADPTQPPAMLPTDPELDLSTMEDTPDQDEA